ncbi:MAG: flagellar M-ring protein FliF [Deltaproteobacteria bacterium]|nr:flagellar M-ring protein FliF [Deltaproteobacteria bacterium]MBW2018951.1 flagellar M-ring protein FliF [Deltaproteobacteria bacterium]MBW2073166.1 flagellar M-ring protein FliF [Deltaproteobacteria bacterium]
MIEQFIAALKAMPVSKKISMAIILALVVGGFALMFFWANQIDYQTLYSNLSQEDAANIVSKLKEMRIPYKLEAGGSLVMVPAEKVYETRLALAGDGLPAGGSVGFEIFDHTDFGTTDFVQRLNYQRALQGELSRTISEFREVEHARILIVLPKDSLFVEDTNPPSASVLLKLKSSLSSEKVAGIVHLVASAVEGLTPQQVTVVDTSGKVLFKGANQGDQAALLSSNNLDYQRQVEGKIAGRVQSMLEGIVGKGKAIVRVSAEIDFDQIDLSEEKYDPDNVVVRSRQRRSESSEKGGGNASAAAAMSPMMAGVPTQKAEGIKSQKEDEVVNYEINKVVRRVIKPSGVVKRLSVAAVVDGTYEVVTAEDGSMTRKYIPRSPKELEELEKIVKRAMGFNADREDQVHVSCLPFSVSAGIEEIPDETGTDWLAYARPYIKPAINFALVLMVVLFVVRPLLRSVKGVGTSVGVPKQLSASYEEMESAALPEPGARDIREKTKMLAQKNVDKAQQVLKGWLSEAE